MICDRTGEALAAVERKTLEDLARTATLSDPGKHPKIFRQLHELTSRPVPILLLEGRPSPPYASVEPVLLGLQIWCAREGIAILYASGPRATEHALVLLARRLEHELYGVPTPRHGRPPSQVRAEAASAAAEQSEALQGLDAPSS